MSHYEDVRYCTGLRAKTGEWQALQMLRGDIAPRVLPRLIIPPAKERDQRQSAMFADRGFLGVAADLQSYWTYRSALIDPTFVIDEFGRNTVDQWFVPAIEAASRAGSKVIPCVRLRDLVAEFAERFTTCVQASSGHFAVVLSLAEASDTLEVMRLATWITENRLRTSDCLIIADFASADFSDPAVVAPVLVGAIETISDVAPWRRIIFQGSNFPERNPAVAGGRALIARNEWAAWCEALPMLVELGAPVLYGDYGADTSKIEFKKSRAKAWPHLRYATDTSWLVVRGSEEEAFSTAMATVAKTIQESGHFAGSGFSEADRQIAMLAAGVRGPGQPSTWRALNMARHITKIVADLGLREGFAVARQEDDVIAEQTKLFTN